MTVRHQFQAALLVILLFESAGASAQAAESCPAGEKRLNAGEECIAVQLFNYLYCLKNSGGGVIELKRKTDSDKGKSLEVILNGKASGVVIAGSAAGKVGISQADRAIQEVETKLDPNLAKQCNDIARTEKKLLPATGQASNSEGRANTEIVQFNNSSKLSRTEISSLLFGSSSLKNGYYYTIVDVDIRFSSEKFNTGYYFGSLSPLELKGGKTIFSGENVIRYRTPELPASESSRASWRLFLGSDKRPDKAANITLLAGPISWNVVVQPKSWVTYFGEENSSSAKINYISHGTLRLVARDPDWVVLRQARILVNSSRNESVLEVLIENKSAESFSVSNIAILANHAPTEHSMCFDAPRWQPLTLNWATLSGAEPDPLASGVQTTIAELKVPVHAELRHGSCGYQNGFRTIVPVQMDVPAQQARRILLRINDTISTDPMYRACTQHGSEAAISECTSKYLERSKKALRGAPPNLGDWDELRVGVVETGEIFPKSLDVAK